ncbi:hypothetical protein FPV67DRAFT_1414931, partial [Lyophyllum atratum]
MKKLRGLSSTQTKYRLGRLPLVIGMPVLVSHNFDVDGGIVNGSKGTVRSIRYTVGAHKSRHVTSCVVHIPASSAEPMAELAPQEMPIVADSVSFSLIH